MCHLITLCIIQRTYKIVVIVSNNMCTKIALHKDSTHYNHTVIFNIVVKCNYKCNHYI